jgi:hypothetical protein
MIMALRDTDFPVPVAPATSTCGMRARSATIGLPTESLPSASVSFEVEALWNSSLSRISRRKTFSRRGLESSMPTTDLPGIGAKMRTLIARNAIERSSASVTMRFTLTPGAGSSSNVLITGPGRTAVTFPATPKSASLDSRIRELVISDCSSTRSPEWTGGSRKLSDGKLNVPAKRKASCDGFFGFSTARLGGSATRIEGGGSTTLLLARTFGLATIGRCRRAISGGLSRRQAWNQEVIRSPALRMTPAKPAAPSRIEVDVVASTMRTRSGTRKQ